MKSLFITSLVSLLLLGASASGQEAKETTEKAEALPPLYAAVFDFAEGSEGLKGQGSSIGQLLSAFLSTEDGVFLVERAELEKILSEQEFSLSGNVTPASAAKVGQLTGAQILITGRIFSAGKKNFAVAKVISAETGRVFGAKASYEDPEDIGDAAEALSKDIAKLISTKGDDMRSTAESFEQMIERLKKGIEAPLPSVYVHVTEEHLRRAVPDPACETEIQKVLEACGFPLAKKAADADLSITGEAFSQLGTRRATLVSCRARAEIKIEDAKTGKLIRADRVTVGAVDLAEEVAGKAALQEAGLKLAESFVVQFKKK